MVTNTQSRVLIVDDEQEVCEALKGFLHEEGFKVGTATNGYEAISQLDQFSPDCILMDVRMPKMNGIEALGMIKFRKPDVEVIMVSAVDKKEIAEKAIQEGAFGYITKPIDLDQVMKELQTALEQRKQRIKKNQAKKVALIDKNPLLRESKNFKSFDHLSNDQTFHLLKAPLSLLKSEIDVLEHSFNVSWLSGLIAREMHLSQVKIRVCELAGLYHDVGKFCFPHHLLNDLETKWNPNEKVLYQKFPIYGQKFVQSYSQLGCLGEIIRHQQEHVNGTGFPDQLTDDMIPIESKIISVANAFDEILEKENIRNLRLEIGEAQDYLDPLYAMGNHQLDMTVVVALSVVMDKWKLKSIGKVKIAVEKLAPKMVLADHLLTKEGMILYTRDTALGPLHIEKINDFSKVNFLKIPISVYKHNM